MGTPNDKVAMNEKETLRELVVVGLGNMGAALADSLVLGGFAVTLWNRNAAKCTPFAAKGARVASSAVDAAWSSDLLILCVTDFEASRALKMTDEIATALNGKGLVQLSTITSPQSRELAEWAIANNIAYLDGAVLGLPETVLEQNCRIVYSGCPELFYEYGDLRCSGFANRSFC